jgi:hypothetical protein
MKWLRKEKEEEGAWTFLNITFLLYNPLQVSFYLSIA